MSTDLQTNQSPTQVAVSQFKGLIGSYQDHISNMLETKKIDPKQFMASLVNSVHRNPKLMECSPESLVGAVIAAAELGLEPNTPFQLSNIIPRNTNVGTKVKPRYEMRATFQIGYQGWIELFDRNPKISTVDCHMVYENEVFEEILGANPTLIHKPISDPKKRGPRKGTYAIAWKTNSPHPVWVYMSKEDIEVIKEKSQSKHTYEESTDPMGWMWMKATIKQIAKKLPKTQEIQKAIYAEDAGEVGKSLEIDQDTKTLKIDPLETSEDRAVTKADERSANVAKDVASMLKKPEAETTEDVTHEDVDLDKDILAAISYFAGLGVDEPRLLAKLKLDDISEIGTDHLIILRDAGKGIAAKKIKAEEFFPPISTV